MHPKRPAALLAVAALLASSAAADVAVRIKTERAIRNAPVQPMLLWQIDGAVRAIYGPGSVAEIFSGGQPVDGPRIGSFRHDEGRAADLKILVGSQGAGAVSVGRQIGPVELTELGQYWLITDAGSVGMPWEYGAIHLDLHKDSSRAWIAYP